MFDPVNLIIGGLLTGLVFGFLLQKARVTRYQTIVGQFLFADNTVLKVMLTAIVTGAIGVYALYGMGYIANLHIKEAALVANVLGGLIFGVGMAIAGYCPGTGVAALGDGSRHALFALLGMVFGAGVYAEVYPRISDNLLKYASYGKTTLPQLTGLSPWIFVAALAAIALTVFVVIERLERRSASSPSDAPSPAPAAD
jgi:hypothetical protein